MQYQEAVNKINSLLVFGVKPGLERIRELMERLGSPEKKLKFIHIAGTNGKGSTCTWIASVLTKAGYRTGRFISPYVLEFRERFTIDGEMIPEQTLADIIEEIFPYVEQMRSEGKVITEFECIFAAAIVWYVREQCDIVVLETGLGGRFDATNIIDTPLAAVITSVSLDHTAILGDTYAKIASEKCGILKPHGTCIAYARQNPSAAEVIRQTAARQDNRLILADGDQAQIIHGDIFGTEFMYRNRRLHIRLSGDHMVRNAVTALETLLSLRDKGFSITDEALQEGFSQAQFPARMEVLSAKPLVVLDGAHNPDGAKALSDALQKYLGNKRKIGLVGMLADKDVQSALSCLAPLFDKLWATQPMNPRKMDAETLAGVLQPFCNNVIPQQHIQNACQSALAELDDNSALIIFGSLYLASQVRPVMLKLLDNKQVI